MLWVLTVIGMGILILAAGASTRLGYPKQLLTYQGQPCIRHIAEVAIAAQHHPYIAVNPQSIAVILGANTDQISPALGNLDLQILQNPQWQTGMASSIQWGLGHLLNTVPDLQAVILMVCDQPFVSVSLLEQLIIGYPTQHLPLVASEYAGTLGVPALFDRQFFPDLLVLQGDRGAKAILQAHRSLVLGIPFPAGMIDIDTPQDVAEFVTTSQAAIPFR